jgi:hypothetical protein
MRAGFTAVAAFFDHESAERFKQEHNFAFVESKLIQGKYTHGNDLYAAHRYLAHADEYDFIGLFGDYDEAKQAAGKRGSVDPLPPG